MRCDMFLLSCGSSVLLIAILEVLYDDLLPWIGIETAVISKAYGLFFAFVSVLSVVYCLYKIFRSRNFLLTSLLVSLMVIPVWFLCSDWTEMCEPERIYAILFFFGIEFLGIHLIITKENDNDILPRFSHEEGWGDD